jgi:hypothetical protein
MSLVKSLLTVVALCLAAAVVASNGNDVQWTFNQNTGLNNWSIANIKTKEVDDTGLNMVSGNDCQMCINNLNLAAEKFSVIEITMESNQGDLGQIFFAAPGNPISEAASAAFPVKASPEAMVYRVNVGSNPLWTGTINTLRIDPVIKEGVKIRIKEIKVVAFPTAWNFNDGNKLDGWSAANSDQEGFKYTADALSFTSGNDCMIVSPELWFPAAKFLTCEVVMKVNQNSLGQIFFATANNVFSEKTSVNFQVKASSDWQTYQVNCGGNPLWAEQIVQLRLDPVIPAGIKVEIKSIRMLP